MSDIAIRVENLSKQYRIGGPSTGLRTGPQARYKTIRESLTEAVQTPFRRMAQLLPRQAYGAAEMDETIWALKDVSFEVKRGEVVGIPSTGSGQALGATGRARRRLLRQPFDGAQDKAQYRAQDPLPHRSTEAHERHRADRGFS